jgi:hypothetical protein
MDGFVYELEKLPNNVLKITISHCPWHQLMENLAGKAFRESRDVVCVADYTAGRRNLAMKLIFILHADL